MFLELSPVGRLGGEVLIGAKPGQPAPAEGFCLKLANFSTDNPNTWFKWDARPYLWPYAKEPIFFGCDISPVLSWLFLVASFCNECFNSPLHSISPLRAGEILSLPSVVSRFFDAILGLLILSMPPFFFIKTQSFSDFLGSLCGFV